MLKEEILCAPTSAPRQDYTRIAPRIHHRITERTPLYHHACVLLVGVCNIQSPPTHRLPYQRYCSHPSLVAFALSTGSYEQRDLPLGTLRCSLALGPHTARGCGARGQRTVPTAGSPCSYDPVGSTMVASSGIVRAMRAVPLARKTVRGWTLNDA